MAATYRQDLQARAAPGNESRVQRRAAQLAAQVDLNFRSIGACQ